MTPKDRHATLVVHAKVDRVMWGLTRDGMGVAVPEYARRDALIVSHENGNGREAAGRSFDLRVDSAHGRGCPVPWLASARVEFHAWTRTGGASWRRSKRATAVGEGRRGFRWKRPRPPPTTNRRLVARRRFGFAERPDATKTVTSTKSSDDSAAGGAKRTNSRRCACGTLAGVRLALANDAPKREAKEEAKAE